MGWDAVCTECESACIVFDILFVCAEPSTDVDVGRLEEAAGLNGLITSSFYGDMDINHAPAFRKCKFATASTSLLLYVQRLITGFIFQDRRVYG